MGMDLKREWLEIEGREQIEHHTTEICYEEEERSEAGDGLKTTGREERTF